MSSPTSLPRGWRYRTGALLFAGGILAGLAAGELIRLPRAQAQIPDPAAQRLSAQRSSMETNRLLKQMLDLLRNDTLKVRIVEPDKSPRPRAKKPPAKR